MNNEKIREDFPILNQLIHNHRLAYLDNAATTQKPIQVLETLKNYYSETNANIHRGVHHLSEQATEAFEKARLTVARFINAKESKECIFVRGSTEAINLVATSFGQKFVKEGDEILISAMEHHSNIVPWQMLCQRTGANLIVIPMNTEGELELDSLQSLLTSKTKLLAISQVSNALGTVNPIADIIKKAHAKNIPVLIDGAQSAAHMPVDVQALDCDFFTFSSHKIYGPTGVGVLYGKKKWLEQMPPYQGGGEMISKVTFHDTTYNELPFKFEAGTPAIAEIIAFGSALEYIHNLGFENIRRHENELLAMATNALMNIPGIRIIGTGKEKVGVISFVLQGVHPHDIGSIVDRQGVAIRTGHHCAMPIMDFFQIPGTARISFAIYNTPQDIEQLVQALYEVKRIFKA